VAPRASDVRRELPCARWESVSSRADRVTSDDLVPIDTPIDLDNCAREPIHGHLIPYLTSSIATAVQAPIELSPPIGIRGVTYAPSTFTVEPGHGLVMYSDGLVERRGESIDDGLDRLAQTLGRAGNASASWIWTAMASGNIDDDVTIVTLRRP
jgi:Stage II sporulation protein E (SpoIIE)